MKKYYCFPFIHNCNQNSLRLLCLLILTVKVSCKFPTYPHPTYPNQLCYKCPPGYLKRADCQVGTEASVVKWPVCVQCGNNDYMDEWNRNPRCKSQIKCPSTYFVYKKPSSVSPAVCACNSSSIENGRGECVKGVTKTEYDEDIDAKNDNIKQCEQTLSSLQKPSATSRTTEKTFAASPVTAANSQPCSDNTVLIAVVIVLSTCLLISLIVNVCQWCKCCRCKFTPLPDEEAVTNVKYEKYPKVVPSPPDKEDKTKKTKLIDPQQIEVRQQSDNLRMVDDDKNDHGDVQPEGGHARPINEVPENGRNQPKVVNNDLQGIPDEAAVEETDPLLPKDDSVDNASNLPNVNVVSEMDVDEATDDYLDKACFILEKSIRSNKEDLDRLMRYVLVFDYKLCDDIKKKSKDVTTNLRQAFSTWIRKQGAAASPEALVRALGKHQWNDEADKIAKLYNIVRDEVKTDDVDLELNIAIRICEKTITRGAEAFVRKCLGIEDIDTAEKRPVDLIREAFREWNRRNSLKATVRNLIQQLKENEYTVTAELICEELQIEEGVAHERHTKNLSREDGEEDQRAFTSEIQEGAAKDNEAGPIYPPESHHSNEPVRETTQATADVMSQSGNQNQSHRTSSQEAAPVENKDNPTTVPKVLYGSVTFKATYDDCADDDPGTVKVDEENYEHEIEELDVVDEQATGGGKAVNKPKEGQS